LTSDGRRKYRAVPKLKKFLKMYGKGMEGKRERNAFAERIGTSLQYLVHVGLGHRRVSMELAVKIERATHGFVSVEDLYPSKDWEYLSTRRRSVAAATNA